MSISFVSILFLEEANFQSNDALCYADAFEEAEEIITRMQRIRNALTVQPSNLR